MISAIVAYKLSIHDADHCFEEIKIKQECLKSLDVMKTNIHKNSPWVLSFVIAIVFSHHPRSTLTAMNQFCKQLRLFFK
jgi:hypothetical protein